MYLIITIWNLLKVHCWVLDMVLTEKISNLKVRVMSSENNVILKKKIELIGIYLMKMRNQRGSSIEPWGTPQSTRQHSDVRPSTDKNCLLFVKYDRNQLNANLRTPYTLIFFSNVVWSTQSKGLQKLKNN